MKKSLEEKLGAIVYHMQELRANRINKNTAAMNSYLDDAEVQTWLDQMQRDSRLTNLRYSLFGSRRDQ